MSFTHFVQITPTIRPFSLLVPLLVVFFISLSSVAYMGNVEAGNDSVPVHARGTEDLMKPKAHGSCEQAVQPNLKFGVDRALADQVWYATDH